MIRQFSLFFAVSLLLTSCASTHVNPFISQEPDTSIDKKEFKELTKQVNSLWLKRNEKESLLEFIKGEERIAHSTLRDKEDLLRLARAYYLEGEYFSENDKERAHFFEMATNWGEVALGLNNPYYREKLIVQKLPTDQALDTLEKKDADALYWVSAAMGKWVTTQGLNTLLRYKDRIKKMIDRVSQLHPHYFYGAVYRYNGVYYASLPGFDEGNLKNSKLNFERALREAPVYFSNHTLFAEVYAKKVNDQKLYRRHLEIVVNGNPKLLHDYYPEQMLERERAKKLLEGIITQ